jgi:hypothetical protein
LNEPGAVTPCAATFVALQFLTTLPEGIASSLIVTSPASGRWLMFFVPIRNVTSTGGHLLSQVSPLDSSQLQDDNQLLT